MKKFIDKLGNRVKRGNYIWCDMGQSARKFKVVKVVSNKKIKVKWPLNNRIKKFSKDKYNIYLDCEEYTKIRIMESEAFRKLAFRGAVQLIEGGE